MCFTDYSKAFNPIKLLKGEGGRTENAQAYGMKLNGILIHKLWYADDRYTQFGFREEKMKMGREKKKIEEEKPCLGLMLWSKDDSMFN